MPLDSLFISGLAHELSCALEGARIDKIHMPARDRLVFSLRGVGGAQKLLISAGSDARIHLTDIKAENPETPPAMCVQLRRHLGGGRINRVSQPASERIVELDISAADELGDISQKRLICEMTGRMTNIILTDSEGIIIACLKQVGSEGEHRPVSPGLKYRLPPAQQKESVYDMSRERLEELCAGAPAGAEQDYISARLGGLPPLIMRELICRAAGSQKKLASELDSLKGITPQPFIVLEDSGRADFSALEIICLPGKKSELRQSFSGLLDDFYRQRTEEQAIKAVASGTQKAMTAVKNRLERRLAGQRQELISARGRERLKNLADLITSNLHAIAPGSASVRVTDYFSEGMPELEITLDAALSPQQNAQRLYKKYARQKNAESALTAQIEKGERELEYVENVLYSLKSAQTGREVEEIRSELLGSGYIRDKAKIKKKAKPAAFAPREYELGEGFTALCGRNNVENDRLTHKEAQKSDLWLHARNIPGAHVVVRAEGRQVPDEIIARAAGIAAHFSAASEQPLVAVDYTLARYVKKIPGAGPGMVTYSGFKTASVPPALPEG